MKKSATTPNLQSRSKQLLDDDLEVEDEEDEETLQLQLAAIEAKLKLKKLQQSKARPIEGSGGEGIEGRRPISALSQRSISRPTSRAQNDQNTLRGRVEVPLSPTKRQAPAPEPRSPSRVLLGIDKGWKGSDVSLGRASSVRSTGSRLMSRLSKYDSTRSAPDQMQTGSSTTRPKTFSERLSDTRAQEVEREARKAELLRNRSSGFKLNAEEMEGFKKAAEEAKSHEIRRSPSRGASSTDYGREAVLQAYHENKSSGLRRSNTTGSISKAKQTLSAHTAEPSESASGESDNKYGGDTSLYCPFSQLHLSNRVLPHSFLKRTFEEAEPVRIPWLLRYVHSPDYELPSSITSDFVLFGIVASKSTPRNHLQRPSEANIRGSDDWEKKWDDGAQNDKKFMVMTLTDLKWTISLYLFGTALPRYHRLSPGTVIAVLNPGIMPPKPGKQDSGNFSLTLNSGGDTILEIGSARDMGFCKSVKKDGTQCGDWVDSRKSEFCDFHVDLQIRKTQAGRMGLNGSESSILSSNRLWRGGGDGGGSSRRDGRAGEKSSSARDGPTKGRQGLLSRDGAHYDRWTQTSYYAVKSSAPTVRKDGRPNPAAGDDPFLAAESAPSRETISKSDRLRQRLATEAKEREIAMRLGEGDLGRSRSAAGGEYLRKRLAANTAATSSSAASTPSSFRTAEGSSALLSSSSTGTRSSLASKTRNRILSNSSQQSSATNTTNTTNSSSLSLNTNGKRSADDVRLSPVKRKATLVSRTPGGGGGDGNKGTAKKITRFVTEKGIREAGRESLPGPGVGGLGGMGIGNEEEDDDDDDELEIV